VQHRAHLAFRKARHAGGIRFKMNFPSPLRAGAVITPKAGRQLQENQAETHRFWQLRLLWERKLAKPINAIGVVHGRLSILPDTAWSEVAPILRRELGDEYTFITRKPTSSTAS
jgi:hypothetical protein